jgi:membrane fusion protein (multidrug efflux system)
VEFVMAASSPPPTRIQRLRHAVALALLLAGAAGLLGLWLHSHAQVTTNNAYVVGNITPVSAEISGVVVALYTDDNMVVEAGAPLAQIDPVPYQL